MSTPLPNTILAAMVLGCAVFAGDAFAQNVSYTEVQATQGAASYTAQCARCHGDKGQGGEGTALVGAQFDAVWRGTPVKDLIAFIREFMPADKPATLTAGETVVLTAHILKLNNVPVGAQALTATSAGLIPAK